MPDTKDFYSSTPLEALKAVLGPELHYHFGFYESPETSYEDAQRQAVKALMRFMPSGASVLDLGCGWGGTASMLRSENNNQVTCITNSSQQAELVSSLGLEVIEHDLTCGLPEKISGRHFDVTLLLESYSHINNREALLGQAYSISNRLVMRVNCTANPHPKDFLAFGGTMRMPTPGQLIHDVREAGWRPLMIRDVRMKTLQTIKDWHSRLGNIRVSPAERNLATLQGLCQYAMEDLEKWGKSSPLIDLVAERL
ncbi:MAG: class I SAM-dependent methyltransferase [Alcanivoracaceae bacterium]|nr:class I SAM-dependent methyltransferase [Alcanivoracaceae bacterium]